jgi:uncharacterized protein YdhG (YjbR/CyaY superfamily)
MTRRAQTVDEYIDRFTGPRHELLQQLRTLAQQAAPHASESIKWGYPAWVHPSGTILFMISGHTRHASVAFTPSTRARFDPDLGSLAAGKGTVELSYVDPPPTDLLRRMIAFRVREHEDEGVLWM